MVKTILPNKIKHKNKTSEYFYKMCYITFLFGMPNFWMEDLQMPKSLAKIYRTLSKLCNTSFYFLISCELGAFVTQKNLSNKQETDRWIYTISHPILLAYSVIISRQGEKVKEWMSHVLELKEVYNDRNVEEQMLRKTKWTLLSLTLSCIISMTLHSLSACIQVIKTEGTYTTIITAWPLVDDRSASAAMARVATNILWWIFVTRILGSYITVISLTTCMSFQFKNLQSYFRSLEAIFDEDVDQNEMERKYEDGIKTGIRIHSETFMCVDRIKSICGGVYSGQIVFVITLLVFLLLQMMSSERSMVNAFATVFTAAAVLISTGFFLWNAGDITLEAIDAATALYCSGWHNCRGDGSLRVRTLLVVAMARAQRPVVIKGLGIIDLSYESFLYLVKTSYSVFSVIF